MKLTSRFAVFSLLVATPLLGQAQISTGGTWPGAASADQRNAQNFISTHVAFTPKKSDEWQKAFEELGDSRKVALLITKTAILGDGGQGE